MSNVDKIAKDLAGIIKNSDSKGTAPYDTKATVKKVENGIAWVQIPGGVDETPVQMTLNAKAGDTVQVRVSGGRAWITGNHTSPSTDDTEAEKAKEEARKAAGTATSFITDSDNGIFVHPKNSSQRGVRVTDVVDIIRDGKTVAEFGESVLLGKDGGARARLDPDAFILTDENGDPMFRVDVLDVYGYVPKSVSYSETISSNIVSVAITESIGTGTTITALCTHGTTLYERWSGSVEFTKGTAATKTATLKYFDPSQSVADATMSVTYDGANTLTYDRGGGGDSYGITDITVPNQVLSPTLSYGGAETIGGFGAGFGRGTFSTEQDQTVVGRYNLRGIIYDSGTRYYAGPYAFVIGNGTNDGNRSNALTVDWDGNVELALDTTAASGTTDGDLYAAIVALGWQTDVIV